MRIEIVLSTLLFFSNGLAAPAWCHAGGLISQAVNSGARGDDAPKAKTESNAEKKSAQKKTKQETKKSKDSAKDKSTSATDTCPPDTANKTSDKANGKGAAQRKMSGNASWYGIPFHGRKTASGEVFDMYKLSAAHKTLPMPSFALVEDPRSGNVVMVKVNDRGPYAKGRIMDLSREAARQLGTMGRGVFYIEATVIEKDAKEKSK